MRRYELLTVVLLICMIVLMIFFEGQISQKYFPLILVLGVFIFPLLEVIPSAFSGPKAIYARLFIGLLCVSLLLFFRDLRIAAFGFGIASLSIYKIKLKDRSVLALRTWIVTAALVVAFMIGYLVHY